MNDNEIYVNWQQGAELLDISRGSFFYLVESGQVKSEPNRKPRDGRDCLCSEYHGNQRKSEQQRQKRKYDKRIRTDSPVATGIGCIQRDLI